MADDDRALVKLIQHYGRMRPQQQQQVLNHLSPAERVMLQRYMRAPRDPDTVLTVALAELVETLRDAPIPTVTERGRVAVLAVADALMPSARDPGAGDPNHGRRQSLLEKMGGALGGGRP